MNDSVLPTHDTMPAPGVRLTGDGVDVAVVAPHATKIEFCAVDVAADGTFTERRYSLKSQDYGAWNGHIPGIKAGQRYGFRAHGPWAPEVGHRFNPAKLLTDPYARGFVGEFSDLPLNRGQVVDDAGDGDVFGAADPRDSIAGVPHSVVVGHFENHRDDHHPRIPWRDTIIYEAHVRGLTMELPDVPEHLRGTYAGLAHPVTIAHLKGLGITTIELLPIQAFLSEPHLNRLELSNYWGYNTLGYFAPHADYASASAQASGPQGVIDEVRGMVHLLHEAGIEVILDVVYNHTCEGGVDGPQISWRGLDNKHYYLHDGGTPQRYADVTGTGNTLDFRRPWVIQMALDSLRYWVTEIGVDGFRFDLAVTLGRGEDGFTSFHPFLVALQTDPVLSGTKLIAEPWDVGPGGWRTGQFPAPFAEWNDRFRDAMRGFWLADLGSASRGGGTGGVRELATRLAGSADLFGPSDPPLLRGPVSSINYITAHDGFTLADLVSYDHKHNLANGEQNRDGTSNNLSWNHGTEGEVPEGASGMQIRYLRRRSQRNLLGMLMFAAGTPMITAGDEMGRTQQGNNNAYCQDNGISWVNWQTDAAQKDLLETTKHLIALRKEYSALRVDGFFMGVPRGLDEPNQPDLAWFDAAGEIVSHDEWHDTSVRTLQMLRRGAEADAHVLLVIHGHLDSTTVKLAGVGNTERLWDLVWSSTWENPNDLEDTETPQLRLPVGTEVDLDAFNIQVYVAQRLDSADTA